MALHFSREEFAERQRKASAEMAVQGLHGLLIFRQESMYYLTGYDTFGYCFFQCLYLGGDGRMTLLTGAPDLRQAQHTSVIEDIRIWVGDRPTGLRAHRHAQSLRRCLARVHGGTQTGASDRWSVRCPCPYVQCGRLPGTSAQRLRLQPGRDLHAHVDGLADVLHWQCLRRAAEYGVLPAHDSYEQRRQPRDDTGPNRSGYRGWMCTVKPRVTGAGHQVFMNSERA